MAEISWSALKGYVDNKGISIDAAEDESFYYLSASDIGNTFTARISKILEDHAAALSEFEADYLPYANRRITTSTGDLKASDGLRNGGVYGALTLTTANTAYEAKVGSNRLTQRKSLGIFANNDMYWGYDNSVTTSTGFPLFKNQSIVFAMDADSTFQIWLVCGISSATVRITEST